MIKGHTDIDIWNTGFFINADYFSDDFIISNNHKDIYKMKTSSK